MRDLTQTEIEKNAALKEMFTEYFNSEEYREHIKTPEFKQKLRRLDKFCAEVDQLVDQFIDEYPDMKNAFKSIINRYTYN